MSDENHIQAENPSTDVELNPELDFDLWPHQWRSVYEVDQYRAVFIIGGRGSGKSFEDKPRVIRWTDPPFPKDLFIGIFAPTDAQLQTVLAPIKEAVKALGIPTTYAAKAPRKWRRLWRRHKIQVPAERLRNQKVWIWKDGTHIFTGTLVNNSYSRAKSLNFNAILIQEGTEPGVHEEAINTLIGCLRCGKATKQPDGAYRCTEIGHLHTLVFAANVPLNDPSHWIRKKIRNYQTREDVRRAEGKPPYFLLLTSSTQDNPATGEDYIDALRAGWDERTFREQTSGNLEVNAAATSYYAFSEQNILSSLAYDPRRPLYMWFDWNATPAAVGWGHDLRLDEVPQIFHKTGAWYFGINGELFSDDQPMVTAQVAKALLEDPTRDERCIDCGHMLREHVNMHRAFVCKQCGHHDPVTKRHCSGNAIPYEGNPGFIHATKNWRGLINHRADIYIYGDANGVGTSPDAEQPGGPIAILRNVFSDALGERVHFRFTSTNPEVVDRVLAMNRAFCDGQQIRHLFAAPHCQAHIDDFREVVPGPDGKPLKVSRAPSQRRKGDYWKRTDSSDGAGYHIAARFPVIRPRNGGLGIGPSEDRGPMADLPEPKSRLREKA